VAPGARRPGIVEHLFPVRDATRSLACLRARGRRGRDGVGSARPQCRRGDRLRAVGGPFWRRYESPGRHDPIRRKPTHGRRCCTTRVRSSRQGRHLEAGGVQRGQQRLGNSGAAETRHRVAAGPRGLSRRSQSIVAQPHTVSEDASILPA